MGVPTFSTNPFFDGAGIDDAALQNQNNQRSWTRPTI
jgi:hypothetical protein